jgi:hypothetical protein
MNKRAILKALAWLPALPFASKAIAEPQVCKAAVPLGKLEVPTGVDLAVEKSVSVLRIVDINGVVQDFRIAEDGIKRLAVMPDPDMKLPNWNGDEPDSRTARD